MKKQDVLPTLSRGFILGTLAIQSLHAFWDKKMGSTIGLTLATLIYVVQNWHSLKSACCCFCGHCPPTPKA